MQNLNNTVLPAYKKVVDGLNNLLSFKEIVKVYGESPEEAINMILDKDVNTDVYNEVLKGLTGELTRAKAVILGRNVITGHMNTLTDLIRTDIVAVGDEIKAIAEVIKANGDTLDEVTALPVMNEIIDKMNTEAIRLEYLDRKIDSVINPKLANTVGVQKDASGYLAIAKNILEGIEYTGNDLMDLVKQNSIHKNINKTTIELINKMVETNEVDDAISDIIKGSSDTTVEPALTVPEHHKYMVATVNSAGTVAAGDKKPHELFMETHKTMVTKLTKMSEYVGTFEDLLGKVELDTFSDILAAYTSTIHIYLNGTITTDVMGAACDSYTAAVVINLTSATKLLNQIVMDGIDLNNYIIMISEAYDIQNEVLLEAALK